MAIIAFLLAGCAQAPGGAPVGSADHNVHLYVSNQSFDDPTADLRVAIDEQVLFDGPARVEDQHNWMLRERNLTAGSHRVTALERTTGTQGTLDFTLPPGQHRWIVVDYWNTHEDGASFTLTVHDQQVAFD